MTRTKRLFLVILSVAMLTAASAAPVTVLALGETDVTLRCSDGTSTALTVDAETLTGLKDAVEAMTLYPAGLSCSLTQAPILGGFGSGVALAAGGTDFVVGGGQRTFCDTNIAINGHRRSGEVFDAWGVVNQTIPGDAPCGLEGIFRTDVVCVRILTDEDAIVGAYIDRSTGVFDAVGYKEGLYLDWYFHEGKAGTLTPPVMWNSPPLASTTCAEAGFTLMDTFVNGRILVKEHA